jgi:outer membrane lipoprotein-sorting protein
MRSDTEILIKKMEAAYAQVEDYRAKIKVRTYRKDGSIKTKKFVYTFQKPRWVRLDFKSPHVGMTLVYPDQEGDVILHYYFFTIHLSPNNPLLRSSPG